MFSASFLTDGGSGGGGMMSIILMVVLFIGVFYFFGIRPQKKQEREHQNMRDSLAVGDEITTTGGIIGKVVRIREETVTIMTGKEGTTLRILKTSIRSIDVKADAPAETETEEKDKK